MMTFEEYLKKRLEEKKLNLLDEIFARIFSFLFTLEIFFIFQIIISFNK